MPIDPSIPLQVRPPQFMSLSDVFAQQRAQQQFGTQQQLAQSELKTQGLQQQQAGMNIAGQQAMNEAYAQPGVITTGADGVPTIDPSAISSILAGKGQGHLIPSVSKSLLDMQAAAAKVRESKSKLSTEELDYAGAVGAAAKAAHYDPDILSMGLEHAASIYGPSSPSAQALQALKQDPTKAQSIADHLLAASPKQRTTAATEATAGARQLTAQTGATGLELRKPLIAAQTTEAQVKAATEQRQSDAALLATAAKQGPDALATALGELPYARAKVFEGQTDPNTILQLGMKPAEITTAQGAAAGRTETARHDLVTEGQGATRVGFEGQRVGIERGNQAIRAVAADPFNQSGVNPHPMQAPPTDPNTGQQVSGEAYLQTVPHSMREMVKAIAEGRRQPPSNRAQGAGLQLMNAVLAYDPTWSEQKAQIRKAFTTGADGKNIGALNTATVHLDQLADAADAMKNGSFKPGNQLYNYVSTIFGGAAPTNFEGIKAAVAGEMATALKGNATDQEIHTIQATIDRSSSPEQLRGAVTTGLHTLGAKLNTYNERYQQQNPGDTWSPVLPSAAAVFQKYGQNPTAPARQNNSGASAGAAQYKEGDIAVGPGGARVVLKGNQWVPLPAR